MTEICNIFSENNPEKAVSSFASSSTLAKQIQNGEPADIYLSANQKWMDFLEKKSLLVQDTRFDLLSNRIVLIAPADNTPNPVTIGPDTDLADMLGDGRLAMGDPEHVPAGIYGKAALETIGLYDAVKGKIAPSKDVRAPLGIVYATDAAVTDKVRVIGTFPANSHPPIVYPVAVLEGHASPQAETFMVLLKTPEARAVFKKYGFSASSSAGNSTADQ